MGMMQSLKNKLNKNSGDTELPTRFTGSTPHSFRDPKLKKCHITSRYDVYPCSKNGCTALYGHYSSENEANHELKYIKINPEKWKRLNDSQELFVKDRSNVEWSNKNPKSYSL